MRDEIRKVIQGAASGETVQWQSALTDCALLIERHSLDRYADDIYLQLFSDDSLFGVSLYDDEYKELIQLVLKLMADSREKAAMAAWALGKSYAVEYSPKLIESLRRYLELQNDEVVYQILIALENCGLSEAVPLLVDVSKNIDMKKSAEYAREILGRNQ